MFILKGLMEMFFFVVVFFTPVIDQHHFTDDLNTLPSCSGHSRFMGASTGTGTLLFISVVSWLRRLE